MEVDGRRLGVEERDASDGRRKYGEVAAPNTFLAVIQQPRRMDVFEDVEEVAVGWLIDLH